MTAAVVVIVIAVALVAVLAGYYIVRRSKGSIKLALPADAFPEGGVIEGSFNMTTKKSIEGKRLLVAVNGREVIRDRQRDGHTRTRFRDIYRDERVLEEGGLYAAGQSKDYTFQIPAPGAGSDGDAGTGGGWFDSVREGLELLSGVDKQVEWRVEARLDADGVDLSDSRQIYLR